MKILIAHNAYQIRAGEDAVVAAESALLRRYGHEVVLHQASNDDVQGVWTKLATAARSSYSRQARDRLAEQLRTTRPDLVHVHNFFPLLTPAIYDACAAAGIPVVQTLHNYRLICPAATLFRAGAVCEECAAGTPYRAVRHACYRDSRAGTLAVAHMVARHRAAGTWRTKVTRFIALAEFAKHKFVAAGVPAARIAVKPNFVVVDEDAVPVGARAGAVFIGRLSPEKGIATLLAAWRDLDVPLHILGTGPLESVVVAAAGRQVVTMGQVPSCDVVGRLARAAFLILPSVWYEACPMVCLEAMARGVPVIASDIGCLPEFVRDGVTGLLFEAGSPAALANAVRWAVAHPPEMAQMGERARALVREKFSPDVNYRQLMAIYGDAIRTQKGSELSASATSTVAVH